MATIELFRSTKDLLPRLKTTSAQSAQRQPDAIFENDSSAKRARPARKNSPCSTRWVGTRQSCPRLLVVDDEAYLDNNPRCRFVKTAARLETRDDCGSRGCRTELKQYEYGKDHRAHNQPLQRSQRLPANDNLSAPRSDFVATFTTDGTNSTSLQGWAKSAGESTTPAREVAYTARDELLKSTGTIANPSATAMTHSRLGQPSPRAASMLPTLDKARSPHSARRQPGARKRATQRRWRATGFCHCGVLAGK